MAAAAPSSCVGASDVGGAGGAAPSGLLLRWEHDRGRARWLAVVVTLSGEQLRVDVVPAAAVAPVESDPAGIPARTRAPCQHGATGVRWRRPSRSSRAIALAGPDR